MDAEQIREFSSKQADVVANERFLGEPLAWATAIALLGELAAQLAEMNKKLDALSGEES